MKNRIIKYPNCKINLGLNVTGRRDDGFHDIETVFYPLGLKDVLEISRSNDGDFRLTLSGLSVPGSTESNLCTRAYQLLKDSYSLPAVHIHLEKNIPVGSGLGGGSSDAAFTLMALNEIFTLGLSSEEMGSFAMRLGSDCTFFLRNIPCFASGRGEILEPVYIDIRGLFFAVVIPPLHISTAEAYSLVRPARPLKSLKEFMKLPADKWEGQLINDFEEATIMRFPVIGYIKQTLYGKGAVYSSMSGSGSAVYGLFSEIPELAGLFPGCFVWVSPRL